MRICISSKCNEIKNRLSSDDELRGKVVAGLQLSIITVVVCGIVSKDVAAYKKQVKKLHKAIKKAKKKNR